MIHSFYRLGNAYYCTMNIINVTSFDELVSLINNLSDEKSKRILLSKAADVYGNGGKAHIVELTGITYPTLIAGKADSENDAVISNGRVRREGANCKPATEIYPNITEIIEKIIDGNTYGDPSKELYWVASTLSLRKINNILEKDDSITISYVKVSQLLTEMGYSKQMNQKMEQIGMPSPDRNEQFEFIDHTAHEYLENGEPVISLNTYLTILDDKVKKDHENPSVGLILCKDMNKAFVDYVIRDYEKPLGVATYKTYKDMSDDIKRLCPIMCFKRVMF